MTWFEETDKGMNFKPIHDTVFDFEARDEPKPVLAGKRFRVYSEITAGGVTNRANIFMSPSEMQALLALSASDKIKGCRLQGVAHYTAGRRDPDMMFHAPNQAYPAPPNPLGLAAPASLKTGPSTEGVRPAPATKTPDLADTMRRGLLAARWLKNEGHTKDVVADASDLRELATSMFIAESRREGVIPDTTHAYCNAPTAWKMAGEVATYFDTMLAEEGQLHFNETIAGATEKPDADEESGGDIHGAYDFAWHCAKAVAIKDTLKREQTVKWLRAVFGRLCAAHLAFDKWRKAGK